MTSDTIQIRKMTKKIAELNQRIMDLETSCIEIKTLNEIFEQMIDAHSDAIIISDVNGIILGLNENGAKLFHKSKQELIGTSGYNYVGKEVEKQIRSIIENIIKTKQPVFRDESAQGRWWNTVYYPICNREGHVERIVYFIQDITEQKIKKDQVLSEQREYYISLIENSSDLITVVEEDGTIRYQNPTVEKLLGYREDELIGNKIFELFHPKDRSVIEKRFADFLNKSGIGAVIESRVLHKNGDLINVEIIGNNLLDNPNVNGIVFNARDITHRKQAQRTINQLNMQYRSLTENVTDLIFQVTLSGKITYVNESLESITGYTPRDVVGKNWRGFVSKREFARFLFKLKEMANGRKIDSFLTSIVHKNGHFVPVELSGQMVTFDGKKYINAIARDISDRQETERALKESISKTELILDALPDTIFVFDKNGIFKYYHGSEKTLYLPPNEFLGKKVTEVLPTELAIRTSGYINETIKTKKMKIFDYELPIRGENRWYEARLFNYGKNEIMGIVRDITDRKRSSLELGKTKDHLQKIIDSASEFIMAIDKNFYITTWNHTAERYTGRHRRQIIGKPIQKLKIIENIDDVTDQIKTAFQGYSGSSNQIIYWRKSGEKRLISGNYSQIKNINNDIIGVLFIGKDITQDSDIHGKILSGTSYLIAEHDNISAIDMLRNLSSPGIESLYITRGQVKQIENQIGLPNIEIVLLTNHNHKGYTTISDLDELYSTIEKFCKNNPQCIILFDRADYLVSFFSFESFLQTLYRINSMIVNSRCIFLLRVNPNQFSPVQMTLLEEEFMHLPSKRIDDIQLDDKHFTVLKFIQTKSKLNEIVTYGKIGTGLDISKVTVAKRIDLLEKWGLIYIKKSGKFKSVYLTDKGNNLLSKREMF